MDAANRLETNMTSRLTAGLTSSMVAGLGAASIALAAAAIPATANASPACASSPAGSPTRCCVKVGDGPGPGPNCTNNQPVERGLLGNAPIVGRLPGLGGLL
jgi:hypothetical protein